MRLTPETTDEEIREYIRNELESNRRPRFYGISFGQNLYGYEIRPVGFDEPDLKFKIED